MAKLVFNTTGQEEMDHFGTIDTGDYVAQIVGSEMKPTKKKDGYRLNFRFKILTGKFKGRSVFTSLNIDNPSKQAEEIAKKELTSICKACNVIDLKDTEQVHAIPMIINVGIKPASGDYPAQNKINSYKPYVAGEVTDTEQTENSYADTEEKVTGETKKKPWEE